MQHAHKERIVLRDRKGFVRIAVEEGLDGGIVPVYHYGNTKVFDFMPQVRMYNACVLTRERAKHHTGMQAAPMCV